MKKHTKKTERKPVALKLVTPQAPEPAKVESPAPEHARPISYRKEEVIGLAKVAQENIEFAQAGLENILHLAAEFGWSAEPFTGAVRRALAIAWNHLDCVPAGLRKKNGLCRSLSERRAEDAS
jgi:hypothetical protein